MTWEGASRLGGEPEIAEGFEGFADEDVGDAVGFAGGEGDGSGDDAEVIGGGAETEAAGEVVAGVGEGLAEGVPGRATGEVRRGREQLLESLVASGRGGDGDDTVGVVRWGQP